MLSVAEAVELALVANTAANPPSIHTDNQSIR